MSDTILFIGGPWNGGIMPKPEDMKRIEILGVGQFPWGNYYAGEYQISAYKSDNGLHLAIAESQN